MDAKDREPAARITLGAVAAVAGIAAACAPVAPTGTAPPAAPPVGFPTVLGPVTEGADRISAVAPALDGVVWLDGKAHPTSEARGKVLLVRWWTLGCIYCVHSAPALRSLAEKHGESLAVRAIFHPKPAPRAVTQEEVRAAAAELGLGDGILLGLDADWSVLDRWWLTTQRTYTSVTFLIDRTGRIRLVHSGTEFHQKNQVPLEECARDPQLCANDYATIDAAITELAKEPAPATR